MGVLDSISKFLTGEPVNEASPLYAPRYVNTNRTAELERKWIEKIHNEFDTAPDRLLEEAKALIEKENNVQIDKRIFDRGETLNKLGFVKVADAVTSDAEKKRIAQLDAIKKAKREEAEIILYYKASYPFLKFLTIDELNRICKKYGLIYTYVSKYIGTVPDKNLKEIENGQDLFLRDIDPKRNIISQGKYTLTGSESISWLNHKGIDHNFMDSPVSEILRWSTALNAPYGLTKDGGFQIAAPAGMFDLTGMQKKDGSYEFGDIPPAPPYQPRITRDPIVFKYCRGGILVYSKWGLEASDPALINPVEN